MERDEMVIANRKSTFAQVGSEKWDGATRIQFWPLGGYGRAKEKGKRQVRDTRSIQRIHTRVSFLLERS